MCLLPLDDIEQSVGYVGLLSLAKNLPDHEFFFALNQETDFTFFRDDDLVIKVDDQEYFHPVFTGYSASINLVINFFGNKSFSATFPPTENKEHVEIQKNHLLLEGSPEIDFILKTPYCSKDFSLLLLPERLTFPPKILEIEDSSNLYQNLAYYE